MSGRRLDLLHVPVLGRFLGWRHARSVVQSVTLALAVVVIVDGLTGPTDATRNWAGVLPWVHWRGLIVVALLAVGNVFCFACPFMLPRRLAKRWFRGDRPVPAVLRSKWTAALLLASYFAAYEAFDLWNSPWLAAWITIGYFASAFAVDAVFRGAAFCKHLCPIGQFHFVNSMASPFEVGVRSADVCASCTTKDCIRGRRDPVTDRVVQNGCELWLFQPLKVGNLDCTFCLECLHACPHDNVGVLARRPAAELWADPVRSGVGRLTRRPDLAALAALLTFAAFVNAFGMVGPGAALVTSSAGWLGAGWEPLVTAGWFGLGLVVLPFALVFATAAASRALSRERAPLGRIATRAVFSLVPVGFGMWIAHYLLHLLSSGDSIVPLVLRAAGTLAAWGGMGSGWLASGLTPNPTGMPSGPGGMVMRSWVPETWILPLEVGAIELGLVVSMVVAYRIAARELGAGRRALRAAAPWMALAFGLSVFGLWMLTQPMDMRGSFLA